MKVLVVGGGGREHALCWKLKRSPSVSEIICAPGNAGIINDARCVNIDADDVAGQLDLASKAKPDLVVIGPEVPLVLGLADQLREKGFSVFGPGKDAAQLEGSKAFSKQLMAEAGVPTARFETHSDIKLAEETIRKWGAPIVIKASGLAAGKGVIVAEDVATAITAARDMLSGTSFGNAGREVVIEEFLSGEEASLFFLISGDDILWLDSSQDHKRQLDGDLGPNTGGMGAYSPAPCVTPEITAFAIQHVARPTVDALKSRGMEYIGILYCGLMLTAAGPRLLEYNVRFGDPECQPLMSRLKSDLGEVLLAAADGHLAGTKLAWDERAALTVVVASSGYPGSYEKGQVINGLDEIESAGATVFHAGTAKKNGRIVNSGGRVLGINALGDTVSEAQQSAYRAMQCLDWPSGFYRRDIGFRAVDRKEA
ncbi:MAG: phosphoribosylamine--glycine ligase [Mariprofundaceae bacterium]